MPITEPFEVNLEKLIKLILLLTETDLCTKLAI